jgi:hypothetical protein
MKTTLLLLTLAMVCGPLPRIALAQRGMGQASGVARQSVKPDVVTLSGTLAEIKTGPCEKTTGRSPIGTHLLLKTDKGDALNIHLGPQSAVADTVAKLTAGQAISVRAFRTELMPDKHYTAQSLTVGQTTIELRDAGLRPVWAGPGSGRGRAALPPAEAKGGSAAPSTPPAPAPGRAAGGPPWAGGGRGPDATFQADREIFHSLLEDHTQIHRTVTNRADGVETLTESDDPNVALAIQGHATAMHDRIKKGMPIHLRDPLFAAVFANAAKIKMDVAKTEKGVHVVETSEDPYVVKLIQAHAQVVNLFVAHGFSEARQNHVPPEK